MRLNRDERAPLAAKANDGLQLIHEGEELLCWKVVQALRAAGSRRERRGGWDCASAGVGGLQPFSLEKQTAAFRTNAAILVVLCAVWTSSGPSPPETKAALCGSSVCWERSLRQRRALRGRSEPAGSGSRCCCPSVSAPDFSNCLLSR